MLFKSVETLTNSLISSLSTSTFKAAKSLLAAKLDVSTTVVLLILFSQDNLTSITLL